MVRYHTSLETRRKWRQCRSRITISRKRHVVTNDCRKL